MERLFGAQRLNGFYETRLGAGRLVAMNDAFGRCLIELLGGHSEFGLALLYVAGGDRLADFAELCAYDRFDRSSAVGPADGVSARE